MRSASGDGVAIISAYHQAFSVCSSTGLDEGLALFLAHVRKIAITRPRLGQKGGRRERGGIARFGEQEFHRSRPVERGESGDLGRQCAEAGALQEMARLFERQGGGGNDRHPRERGRERCDGA
jgi:hypothetical protein